MREMSLDDWKQDAIEKLFLCVCALQVSGPRLAAELVVMSQSHIVHRLPGVRFKAGKRNYPPPSDECENFDLTSVCTVKVKHSNKNNNKQHAFLRVEGL